MKYAPRILMLLMTALLAAPLIGAADPPPAEPPAAAAPPPALDGNVYIIPIRSQITEFTSDFVQRRVAEAVANHATAIVLDMDTPGGLVSASIEITKLLKSTRTHTVAWVHHEAISAGAMISIACAEIVIAPRSKIGDCAVIMIGVDGLHSLGPTERAKQDSYILAEFRDSALANNYPLALAEAMVTLGPAIYRIKNLSSGEMRYVFANKLADFGLDAAGTKTGEWTLDRNEVRRENELVTLLTDKAVEYGFAKAVIADEAELAAYLHAEPAAVHRFDTNWSETMVEVLTNPIVRTILLITLLMAIYAELHAPGFGLAAAVALLAGIGLFGAPYMAGLSSMTAILIVILGFLLLGVEIFAIPGFGMIGILGLALMFFGLVLSFIPPDAGPGLWPSSPAAWMAARQAIVTVIVSLIGTVIGGYFITKYFGRLPVLSRLVLQSATAVDPGGAAVAGGEVMGPAVRIGDTGRVTAECRPSGLAEIGGQVVDVVAPGQWIETGKAVRVVEVHGNRVVVEEA
jgi:membrane-bound serine protease (ClpP class)